MQLVEKHIIRRTNKYYQEIDSIAFLSKNLYNATLFQIRQHFFKTKKLLSYPGLQKQFQDENHMDYRLLPSKVAQWTMKMAFQNFGAFFKSLRDYKKNPKKYQGMPRIPKYLDKKKGRYLLTFTNQAISKRELDKNWIVQPSGMNIKIHTKLQYDDIAQVRIVKRINCYVLEIIYNKHTFDVKTDNGLYAAIDLGLNNLCTVVTNSVGDKPFVISGKKIKSINYKYNKDLAKAKSIMETRNKTKTSKRINQLTFKRNCRVNDYLHKASRYIVNQLLVSNINTLIIGNNKEWKQDINIGNVNNQNFVQIPYATLISMLKYKCELCGINVETTEESYTSKCSFLDMEEIKKHEIYCGKRIHRGLFRASDGRLINADVNGAYNIMIKCKPKAFVADGVKGVVVHPVFIKSIN